jgi:hypothetical protein
MPPHRAAELLGGYPAHAPNPPVLGIFRYWALLMKIMTMMNDRVYTCKSTLEDDSLGHSNLVSTRLLNMATSISLCYLGDIRQLYARTSLIALLHDRRFDDK